MIWANRLGSVRPRGKAEMLKFGKAKKANRNAVQVRPREERSDETSTKFPAIAADIDA